jgi:hypothetical protein
MPTYEESDFDPEKVQKDYEEWEIDRCQKLLDDYGDRRKQSDSPKES